MLTDFGKHRELTRAECYEKHPEYIEWLRARNVCNSNGARGLLKYADLRDKGQRE